MEHTTATVEGRDICLSQGSRHDEMIDIDASLREWSAVCSDIYIEGLWSLKKRSLYINYLELLVGSLNLQCSPSCRKKNIHTHSYTSG